jgi:hypothetical protein
LTPKRSLFTFNRSAENHCKNAQSGGTRPAYPKHISQGAAPKAAIKTPKAGDGGPHIQSIFHRAQRRGPLQKKPLQKNAARRLKASFEGAAPEAAAKKKPQGGNYKLFSIFSLQTETAPGVFSDGEIVIWSLEIIIWSLEIII